MGTKCTGLVSVPKASCRTQLQAASLKQIHTTTGTAATATSAANLITACRATKTLKSQFLEMLQRPSRTLFNNHVLSKDAETCASYPKLSTNQPHDSFKGGPGYPRKRSQQLAASIGRPNTGTSNSGLLRGVLGR